MHNPNELRSEGLSYEGHYTGPGEALQRAIRESNASTDTKFVQDGSKNCTVCHERKLIKGGRNAPNDYGIRQFICKECATSTPVAQR